MGDILSLMMAGASYQQGNVDTGLNALFSGLNYKQQQEAFEYMKEMDRVKMQREDSAVSRRVQDLENAGLNKVLAAGSAAQTSQPIKLDAPQINYQSKRQQAFNDALQQANLAYTMSQQKANIEKTSAETAYINAQKEGVNLDNMYKSGTQDSRIGMTNKEYQYYLDTYESNIDKLEGQVSNLSADTQLKVANTELAKVDAQLRDRQIDRIASEIFRNNSQGVFYDSQVAKVFSEIAFKEAIKDYYEQLKKETEHNLKIAMESGTMTRGSQTYNMYMDEAEENMLETLEKWAQGFLDSFK